MKRTRRFTAPNFLESVARGAAGPRNGSPVTRWLRKASGSLEARAGEQVSVL